MPVIGLRESPHFGLNIVVKRVMDIAAVAASRWSCCRRCCSRIAVAGQADEPRADLLSPGAVRAQRPAVPDAEVPQHARRRRASRRAAVWTRQGRPAARRLGAFLRQTSLDELPQLINVLTRRHEPRRPAPERPVFIQQVQQDDPQLHGPPRVKAGITGWAQVNGWRGNTSLRKRIQFDLYYITHWNPLVRPAHPVADGLEGSLPPARLLSRTPS